MKEKWARNIIAPGSCILHTAYKKKLQNIQCNIGFWRLHTDDRRYCLHWNHIILLIYDDEFTSLMEKQRPESSADGSGRHQIHQETDGQRHQRGNLGGEHGREQSREQPDRHLGPSPLPFAALEFAQEVEEQRDGGVCAGHERHRARVLPWCVHGEHGAARQSGDAERGQHAVRIQLHLSLAFWHALCNLELYTQAPRFIVDGENKTPRMLRLRRWEPAWGRSENS